MSGNESDGRLGEPLKLLGGFEPLLYLHRSSGSVATTNAACHMSQKLQDAAPEGAMIETYSTIFRGSILQKRPAHAPRTLGLVLSYPCRKPSPSYKDKNGLYNAGFMCRRVMPMTSSNRWLG